MDNYSYVVTKSDESKDIPKDIVIEYQCEEKYVCKAYSTDTSIKSISYNVVKNSDNDSQKVHEVKYSL